MGRGSRQDLAPGTRGRCWEAGVGGGKGHMHWVGGRGEDSFGRAGPGRNEGRKDWQVQLHQAEHPCLQSLAGDPAAPSCSTYLQRAGAKRPTLLPAGPRQAGSRCSCRCSMHTWLPGGSQGFHPGAVPRNTTETNNSPSQQGMLRRENRAGRKNCWAA